MKYFLLATNILHFNQGFKIFLLQPNIDSAQIPYNSSSIMQFSFIKKVVVDPLSLLSKQPVSIMASPTEEASTEATCLSLFTS